MALVAEYRTTAQPDRGIVEVYDADAYEADREAAVRSRAEVVAGNGYHLYLHTLQPDLRVEVAIRIWDGPQDPPTDAEGHTDISLESETGDLVVNQLTLGPAGTTRLPRPGVYAGHAWWAGRQTAADYYDQNIRGGVRQPTTTEEVGRAREQSPVTERYTFDLWFLRECEPEDEEA
ncbi:hypothetical protein ABZ759_13010 [Streptomyces sp. NPDC047860]|uniref:hypothetical protein n=1 Tax=Streptomyces sp. NPDC047860 TaxID=3155743 RepID=UPI003410D90D